METKSRESIGPVIATAILVVVAITIAVTVSYWVSGVSSRYPTFEKVEIQSSTCSWNTTNKNWDLTLTLKNTGTATATLSAVYLNDIAVDAYGSDTPGNGKATTSMSSTGLTINSGATVTVKIYIDGPGDDSGESATPVADTDYWRSVTSGTTVNVKIHSAGDMDYIKLIELV